MVGWHLCSRVVQQENEKNEKNLRIEKMYIDLTRTIDTVTYKTQKMRMSIGLTRSVNNLHQVVYYAYYSLDTSSTKEIQHNVCTTT